MRMFKNSVEISHELISKVVCEGDYVIDATAGNGNDTLFLSKLIGREGHVYGFDIQSSALQNTRARLESDKLEERVTLVNDGHQNMDQYVKRKVKAVIFNLGYLPGGDHNISTKSDTTIQAIQKSLELVVKNGIVVLVIYSGGDSGFEEKNAVIDFVSSLDNKRYTVLMHQFINQKNNPPIAVCIEKTKQ